MKNFTQQDEDILTLVKQLSKALREDCDKRLMEFGLTSVQGRILFHIHRWNLEGKEVHQNDIEKHSMLSKSTVSGLIQRLEKKDMIQKENSHPYVVLKPTEKGSQIVETIHNSRNETINKLFKGFSDKEKERIIENIKQLIENIKEES